MLGVLWLVSDSRNDWHKQRGSRTHEATGAGSGGVGGSAHAWALSVASSWMHRGALAFCSSCQGAVINDLQALLLTPPHCCPTQITAATSCWANEHSWGWTGTADHWIYARICQMRAISFSQSIACHFLRALCNFGTRAMISSMTVACAALRLRGRLCTGSQLVTQLSRSDLWPLDSNLSSLPVQYCYNWQLMRPDMLSSRALNRTSIFPRHKHHFCSVFHTTASVLFASLVFCLATLKHMTRAEKASVDRRRCFSEGKSRSLTIGNKMANASLFFHTGIFTDIFYYIMYIILYFILKTIVFVHVYIFLM